MNRHPRFETFLEKIHLPEFLYREEHLPAAKTRRVSRQEQRFLTAIIMDRRTTGETGGEFYPPVNVVPPSPEDVALRFF